MPSSAKPRKKYRPKRVLLDPVGYVVEGLAPVTTHGSYLLDLKLRNSEAMAKLMRGGATKQDMDILIAMYNIVESLRRAGFGSEYLSVTTAAREALTTIAHRSVKHQRYTPDAQNIKDLNALMDLHDAQFDVITLQDLDKAITYAKAREQDKDVVRLPLFESSGSLIFKDNTST